MRRRLGVAGSLRTVTDAYVCVRTEPSAMKSSVAAIASSDHGSGKSCVGVSVNAMENSTHAASCSMGSVHRSHAGDAQRTAASSQ